MMNTVETQRHDVAIVICEVEVHYPCGKMSQRGCFFCRHVSVVKTVNMFL